MCWLPCPPSPKSYRHSPPPLTSLEQTERISPQLQSSGWLEIKFPSIFLIDWLLVFHPQKKVCVYLHKLSAGNSWSNIFLNQIEHSPGISLPRTMEMPLCFSRRNAQSGLTWGAHCPSLMFHEGGCSIPPVGSLVSFVTIPRLVQPPHCGAQKRV